MWFQIFAFFWLKQNFFRKIFFFCFAIAICPLLIFLDQKCNGQKIQEIGQFALQQQAKDFISYLQMCQTIEQYNKVVQYNPDLVNFLVVNILFHNRNKMVNNSDEVTLFMATKSGLCCTWRSNQGLCITVENRFYGGIPKTIQNDPYDRLQ